MHAERKKRIHPNFDRGPYAFMTGEDTLSEEGTGQIDNTRTQTQLLKPFFKQKISCY
jgi:hypothetical protein